MKLLQQVNNITTQGKINESSETLVAALRKLITDNATISEDKAHIVAKVMVMWSIVKNDAATLTNSLIYDMVCTIIQRVLTSNNHTLLTGNMLGLANQIYGDPKNITKVQRYITKLSKQVDTKVNYKIRAMNIASHLLHKHTDPNIEKKLLAML